MTEKKDPAVAQRRVEDQKWYIQRGVPIIPLLTFLFALVMQTGAFVVIGIRYATSMEQKVEQVVDGTKRLEVRVDRVETRLDELKSAFNNGLPSAAVNARRIDELERAHMDISRRLLDLEKRR